MSLLTHFRKPIIAKTIGILTNAALLAPMFIPLEALALTSGPSQPEVQSFEPIATTQMVDPFTGDFTYNIPLLDVGGYPINISYHSGISMEQEASCVGLGWNINPGVISRDMNGIPDDFKGADQITYRSNRKTNVSVSAKLSAEYLTDLEVFGLKAYNDPEIFKTGNFLKKQPEFGIQYNNYRGIGYEFSAKVSDDVTKRTGYSVDLGYSSFEGYDVQAGFSIVNEKYLKKMDIMTEEGANLTAGVNSRTGLKHLGLSLYLKTKKIYKKHDPSLSADELKNDAGTVYRKIERISNGNMPLVSAFPSYYPNSESNMRSASYAFSYETGSKLYGNFRHATVSGGVSFQNESSNVITRRAYGSLYHSEALSSVDNQSVVLDYNRIETTNSAISKLSNNISYGRLTTDQYFVSGQGTGSSFKPYISSVGTVYQAEVLNESLPSVDGAKELGVPLYNKHGIDLKYIYSKSKSGPWSKDRCNHILDKYTYNTNNGEVDYEGVYFKNVGEKNITDTNFLFTLGGFAPVSLAIENCNGKGTSGKYGLKDAFHTAPSTSTGKIVRGERVDRNQFWFNLTAEETGDYGLTKYRSPHAKDHHIGEVSVTGEDGRRYVYGLPLYNTEHKEVTFNLDEQSSFSGCGLAEYKTADASINNDNGKDHYFMSKEIPPYAHSYYLTAVLSADYVDVDDNGPTPNDLGDYVLFQYDSAYDDYQWRAPYSDQLKMANRMSGLTSNMHDDKGSYIYGKKVVWYLKKVITRNQTAVFHYNEGGERLDTYEAAGEEGGRGERSLWRLDRIALYAHPGKDLNTGEGLIKTVHFAYSYDLCGNVLNNANIDAGLPHPLNETDDQNFNRGKLTLHKIWFTYQNSTLGTESPYIFRYDNPNPDYNSNDMDRWGTYKASNCSGMFNSEFPYTPQDTTSAHYGARAWNLSDILLPSGGRIYINYESDDYAYVQDKEAMQMMKIKGFGRASWVHEVDGPQNILYGDGAGTAQTRQAYNFVFVELPEGVSSNEEFREKYVKGIKELYFKVKVNLKNLADPNPYFEYVDGFAEIKTTLEKPHCGITADPRVGWIELSAVGLKEGNAFDVNPIAKAAWQYTRLHANYLIFPQGDYVSDPDATGFTKKTIYGLIGFIPEVVNTVMGINWKLLTSNCSKEVDLDESVVRLHNPSGRKYGGGTRVRSLTFSDEWSSFDENNPQASYTTLYEYNMEDGSSSGVASYEPVFGGEEIPQRQPIRYTEKSKWGLALANKLYDLLPYGEAFYPGPSVGYRRVTVRRAMPQDYDPEGISIKRHGEGFTVNEFYTAYDFPTVSGATLLDKHFRGFDSDKKIGAAGSRLAALFGQTINGVTASQGFYIELNDMHGKPRSVATYKTTYEGGAPQLVQKFENVYQTMPDEPKRLDNRTTVLNPDGTYQGAKLIGVDIEALADVHENRSVTHIPGIEQNYDVTPATPTTPAAVLFYIPLPRYTRSENYTQTASFTKVVTRSGILKKTILTENNLSLETENVAFDSKTGEVLLTRTTNAFKRNIYNLNYPAHWTHKGMGQASKNTGLVFNFTVGSDGYAVADENIGEFIERGDEIRLLLGSTNKKRYWILNLAHKATPSPHYQFGLIDKYGTTLAPGNYQGKIIRSGYRNMQAISTGYVTSMSNPLQTGGNNFARVDEFDTVISATAMEYTDEWQRTWLYSGVPYYCPEEPGEDPEEFTPDVPKVNGGDCLGFWKRFGLKGLMQVAMSNLCLASNLNTKVPVCDFEECAAYSFTLDYDELNDPAKKLFPDKTDPDFDIDNLFPDLDLVKQSTPGFINPFLEKLYGYKDMAKGPADPGLRESYGTFVEILRGAASPSTVNLDLINYIEMNKSCSGSGCGACSTCFNCPDCIPYTALKLYSCEPVTPPTTPGVCSLQCKMVFVAQYASHLKILEDANQMGESERTFTGIDGNGNYKYELTFPDYPEVKILMKSTCELMAEPRNLQTGVDNSNNGVVTPPIPGPETYYYGQNPFLLGIYGNWRPKKSYIYYDRRETSFDRKQTADVGGNLNSTNINQDGTYRDFVPFWSFNSGWEAYNTQSSSNPWILSNEITQHNPRAGTSETRDALNIHSSGLYSSRTLLPIATSQNADLNNTLYDGFEDYWGFYFLAECDGGVVSGMNKVNITNSQITQMYHRFFQWPLWTSFNPYAHVSESVSHSGKNSLRISMTPPSLPPPSNYIPGRLSVQITPPPSSTRTDENIFIQGTNDLLHAFNPTQTEYLVSLWMKPGQEGDGLELTVGGAVVSAYGPAMVNPIEGWYKKEYKVVFSSPPNGSTTIQFETRGEIYIDDFRMQPLKSVMSSTNYDQVTMRVTSMLDANNFATFFEYDEEGNLVRTKKETERGIYTISENRKNIRRAN